jgi:hypothetical protein
MQPRLPTPIPHHKPPLLPPPPPKPHLPHHTSKPQPRPLDPHRNHITACNLRHHPRQTVNSVFPKSHQIINPRQSLLGRGSASATGETTMKLKLPVHSAACHYHKKCDLYDVDSYTCTKLHGYNCGKKRCLDNGDKPDA